MTTDATTWREGRPRKRMGSGALIRDEQGRVLLVEPTYQRSWELPGGSVETDESPRATCLREIEEELGLTVTVGRLLCLEWQGPEPDRSESVMFVYDGGVVPDLTAIRLPPDELASYQFVADADVGSFLEERLVRRVRAALLALATGEMCELENGARVG